MSEVLKLEYNAATAAILVTVDALTPLNAPEDVERLGPGGGPIAGLVLQERHTLEDLDAIDPDTAKAFRACLVALEALTRTKVPTKATEAELIRRTALAARNEEAIAIARKEADADLALKATVARELEASIAVKTANAAKEDDARAVRLADELAAHEKAVAVRVAAVQAELDMKTAADAELTARVMASRLASESADEALAAKLEEARIADAAIAKKKAELAALEKR
jgi:hypothetical protein